MSRTLRFIVLLSALASSLIALPGAAGAVTWHNTGDTAFTATTGSYTFSSTGASLSCSGITYNGTTGPSPFVGAVWTGITMTSTSPCTFSGVQNTVTCNYRFTGATQPAGSNTVGGFLDTTCDLNPFFGTCHWSGSLPAQYHNPSGATPGRFTIPTSNVLRLSNGTSGTCALGNGDALHYSAQVAFITSATGGPSPHLGPVVTRTA